MPRFFFMKKLSFIINNYVYRLYVGVGAMYSDHDWDGIKRNFDSPKNDYRWTEEKLIYYLQTIKELGIKHIFLYQGQWKAIRYIEDYYFSALADFLF